VWNRRNLILAVFSCCAFMPGVASGQIKPSAPEQSLFNAANRERMAMGIKPLKWDQSLAAAAHTHALRMAQQNDLSHQFPGEPSMEDRAVKTGARFSSLAENIAEGPQADTIHAEWMESPPHRANLLDPQMDSLGVAVVEKNGTLFAVEDFAQIIVILSLAEQEKGVSAGLQLQGLKVIAANQDARQTCLLNEGFTGKVRPGYIAHYTTPSLNAIPDLLEEQIKTGQYHSAEVGACVGKDTTDFTLYRLAILLF